MASEHLSLRRARNAWLLTPFLFTSSVLAQDTATGATKLWHAPPHARDVKTPEPARSPATRALPTARPNASTSVALNPALTDARRADARTRTPEIDFTRVYMDAPGDGSIWAQGASYKASVDDRRFTYIPYFGAQAPHNFPVSFELESAAVGGRALELAHSGTVVRDEDRVTVQRGAALETYDFVPEGVEQAFVFRSLPSGGDLTLRLSVASELAACTSEKGIEFTNELGGVRYGHATVLDCAGKSLAITSTWTEGAIEFRVPAEFLADAQFPVTIDPSITTFNVEVFDDDDFSPDIAFEHSTSTYLVVWERAFSATDHDVWARAKDSLGTIIPVFPVPIDVTDAYWAHPRVASNGLASQFLVVAAVGDPAAGARKIFGREREAEAPITQSAQFQISDTNAIEDQSDPDVGGDPVLQGPTHYCVVWTRVFSPTDRDVHAKLVDANATLFGTTIFLENSSGTNDIHPVVSKSDGPAPFDLQDWNIVWERPIPAALAREYHGAQIHWDGSVSQTPFTITANGVVLSHAAVSPGFDVTATNERDYVVAFDFDFGTDHDIFFWVLNTQNVRDIRSLSAMEFQDLDLGVLTHDQLEPAVETDGSAFAIAYSEQDETGDFDVWISSLSYDGTDIKLLENHASFGATATSERHTRLTSARSGNALGSLRYGAVWEDASGPDLGDIRGGIYERTANSGFVTFCSGDGSAGIDCPCRDGDRDTGCPNSLFAAGATLRASGVASVANDSVVLRGAAMPNATTLYFQGQSTVVPFISGDGITCVGTPIVRLSTKTNAGNTSQFPVGTDARVSVRGAIPAAGGTRYYQCVYRNSAASFCPPGTANRTNAVSVTWTP